MDIKEEVKKVKQCAPVFAGSSLGARNQALEGIVQALEANKEKIFAANQEDMEQAEKDGIAAPVLKRLKFDTGKMQAVTAGIKDLIAMEDPLFQISALCIKSGNCVILKGGSEAKKSNRILFEIIQSVLVKCGLPEHAMLQLEARTEITELLDCHQWVDLLIPRGSNAFVQYIMNNTKIPVMGHADGICHIYVDKEADIEKAIPIILDAKTQYVSACNTVETLLVHKDILDQLMPKLQEAFKEKQVTMRGSKAIVDMTGCEEATEEDNCTEYLDYIISAKEVEDVVEAVGHINRYGSHHTDAIITENSETAAYFMRMVDSAGVYQNCSTRFADGYRYGFGAEVGISTSKLHARGPVGLEGLLSYKYKLFGSGQIVEYYAEGKASFHFKDLE